MTAMLIDDGKRVAAGGARLQWHTTPIADIDLIASNTRGEENGVASQTFDIGSLGVSVIESAVHKFCG